MSLLPYLFLAAVTAVVPSPLPSVTAAPAPTPPPIGRTSATVRLEGSSQTYVPREAYRDLGEPQLSRVLDETPGVTSVHGAFEAPGTLVTNVFPSIHGSAVWETAVLLDGIKLNLPTNGTIDIGLIPPVALQFANVLRDGNAIAYPGAVAGAVDIRLLDATPGALRAQPELGADGYGTLFFNTPITGTPGRRLAVAAALDVEGRDSCCIPANPSAAIADTAYARLTYRFGTATDAAFTFFGSEKRYDTVVDRGVAEVNPFVNAVSVPSPLLVSGRSLSLESLQVSQTLAPRTTLRVVGYAITATNLGGSSTDDDPTVLATTGGERIALEHRSALGTMTAALEHTDARAQESFGSYGFTAVAPGSLAHATTASLALDRRLAPSLSLHLYAVETLSANLTDVAGNGVNTHFATGAGRIALTFRPAPATSYRLGIAPGAVAPTLEMLSAPSAGSNDPYGGVGLPPNALRYESSVAYDAGMTTPAWDAQTTLDVDLSRRVVHGFFADDLLSSQLYGLPYAVWRNGGTLYADALDLSLARHPRIGFGFVAALGLVHASQHDFLASTIPNGANSFGETMQVGALTQNRTPYANGYGEISYHFANGSRLEAGATYYGNNNAYNEPAFFDANANWEQQLDPKTKLQFSLENALNRYGTFLPVQGAGVAIPVGRFGYTPNGAGPGPRTLRFIVRRAVGGPISERR
jgi:hypothetical protein